jgi:hypothetical protein
MAKKKDWNVFELDGTSYTITERVREESDVRSIPYPIESYVKEVDNGEICRDPLIQRTDDQWTKKQKSKLIEAVLHNRPIGTIALANGRAESKNYLVTSLVDGLQRTTALVDFYHDKFAIDKKAAPVICRLVTEDGETRNYPIEIAGKKYSQLPEAIQKFFNKYRLDTYIHEGFTDEELDDIVFCMNNGKTPTSYQKMRFMLGSENMRVIQPICNSLLWEDVDGCKAKNDSVLCCVIRTLMIMTHYGFKNLGAASMNSFIDEDTFNEYVKFSTLTELGKLVDQLEEVKYEMTDDELEFLNACNIPHLLVNLKKFNSMPNPDGRTYIEFLREYWQSEEYELYQSFCESGSGSSLYSDDNVSDRQCCIDDFLDSFLDCPVEEINTDIIEDTYTEIEEEETNESRESEADRTVTDGNREVEEYSENSANDNRPLQTDNEPCEYGSTDTPEERVDGNYLQKIESEPTSA